MEKQLIHFDHEKFESKKLAAKRLCVLIQQFVEKFNTIAKNTEFAIESNDDINLAMSNLQEYVLRRTKEDFKIGSKTLTKEKALEMGLIENPDWLRAAQELCEKTKEQLKGFNSLDNSLYSWFVCQSGTVSLNQEKIDELHESCSYYLNESKTEDYDLINKLIELSKKRFPDMVAGNYNGFSIVDAYIKQTCRNLPTGNSFSICPDPGFFSKD